MPENKNVTPQTTDLSVNKKRIERELIRQRLKSLLEEESKLPPEQRTPKYDLMIAAGFPIEVAQAVCGMLIQNGKVKVISRKGFDEDSAKLVIQEIMHDPAAKEETRLKAAEDVLKIEGGFDAGRTGDQTSQILAGLLRDIFQHNTNRSKVLEVEQIPIHPVEQNKLHEPKDVMDIPKKKKK